MQNSVSIKMACVNFHKEPTHWLCKCSHIYSVKKHTSISRIEFV